MSHGSSDYVRKYLSHEQSELMNALTPLIVKKQQHFYHDLIQ